ncbi:MAG TPA: malate synthase A, partial [Streptosporangiaceae bacterium]
MAAVDGVEITGPRGDRYDEVLSPDALRLLASLQRELGPRRAQLLAARETRQVEISAGGTFDFLPGSRPIRDDLAWRVAAPAPGLVDRRVEITGPTERKMTINALNSGANVWLADFEDANT